MKAFIFIISMLLLGACGMLNTEPMGKSIELPSNMRLVEVSLEKDSSVWMFMESMDSLYIPKTKVLQKTSKHGIIEKKFVFKEKK